MAQSRIDGLKPVEAYRRYLTLIARTSLPSGLCRYLDDSDIVQMTLVEAHRDAAAFRGHSQAEQMAWLRRILTRNVADVIKGLHRAKRDIARNASLCECSSRLSVRVDGWWVDERLLSPSEIAEQAERAVSLVHEIECLPEDQKEAVLLRHVHGLDLRAIAELMMRSTSSVASLIHRGTSALRTRLDKGAD